LKVTHRQSKDTTDQPTMLASLMYPFGLDAPLFAAPQPRRRVVVRRPAPCHFRPTFLMVPPTHLRPDPVEDQETQSAAVEPSTVFYYISTSADGRTVARKTMTDAQGRRTHVETRTLKEGDRVVTKETRYADDEERSPAQETQEGLEHGQEAENRAVASAEAQERRVVVEGAEDEAAFDALWSARTQAIEKRRAEALQEAERRRKRAMLHRAEVEAAEVARYAEELQARALRAMEAAESAKQAYEELRGEVEEGAQEKQGDCACEPCECDSCECGPDATKTPVESQEEDSHEAAAEEGKHAAEHDPTPHATHTTTTTKASPSPRSTRDEAEVSVEDVNGKEEGEGDEDEEYVEVASTSEVV